jgi:beta-phosphoglucomutase family hydrolase
MAGQSLDTFDAVLFDLDGVITASATLHRACWKQMFDEYLSTRAAEAGEPFEPFTDADYKRYVDGRLRYDGVRSFLESRGIVLPEGDPEDPPAGETVCGLGNRKNALIVAVLAERGIDTYHDAVALIGRLRSRNVRLGVVSASKNCGAMLEAAGLSHLFEVQVDGSVAGELGLPGKPAPDTFLEGARRLGVVPERAVVVEDAISGVQAGRAGGFGLVVGVDRTGDADALADNGADVVVDDLTALL